MFHNRMNFAEIAGLHLLLRNDVKIAIHHHNHNIIARHFFYLWYLTCIRQQSNLQFDFVDRCWRIRTIKQYTVRFCWLLMTYSEALSSIKKSTYCFWDFFLAYHNKIHVYRSRLSSLPQVNLNQNQQNYLKKRVVWNGKDTGAWEGIFRPTARCIFDGVQPFTGGSIHFDLFL